MGNKQAKTEKKSGGESTNNDTESASVATRTVQEEKKKSVFNSGKSSKFDVANAEFFELAKATSDNIASASGQIGDRDRNYKQTLSARGALRKTMNEAKEGLDALKQKHVIYNKKSKYQQQMQSWKAKIDELSEEHSEMVAHNEGRLAEYRKDKQRRKGGFDDLAAINSKSNGRTGKMTRAEQDKMKEIRAKEQDQNELLDGINDNLDYIGYKAKQMNNAIDDQKDLLDEVIKNSARTTRDISQMRDDVQVLSERTAADAKKRSNKQKQNSDAPDPSKLVGRAAGALIGV